MHDPFFRRFRYILIAVGLIWRVAMIVGLGLLERARFGPAVFLFAWGMAPYVVLALLAASIRNHTVLTLAALVLVGSDMLVGWQTLHPGSSTDSVALVFHPLFALLGLIPLSVFVGWTIRTYR